MNREIGKLENLSKSDGEQPHIYRSFRFISA
jgi:hypothetical protein